MNQDVYRAKEHYQDAEIASEYDDVRFKSWYGKLAHQTETKALERIAEKYFIKPAVILDIPCGTGRLFPILLDKGFQVIGVDISNEMMNVGRRKYKVNPYVGFKRAEAEHLPFGENEFNYVTSYRFMCHLPKETRSRVLDEMVRVTQDTLVINYHVNTLSPLFLFNKIFRSKTCALHTLSMNELKAELRERKDLRILEMKKLSWYERSSLLVVLKKVQL